MFKLVNKFVKKHQDYLFLMGGIIVGLVILQLCAQDFLLAISNQKSPYLKLISIVIDAFGGALAVYAIAFCLLNIYKKFRAEKNRHEK
jgi:hypothetical protein